MRGNSALASAPVSRKASTSCSRRRRTSPATTCTFQGWMLVPEGARAAAVKSSATSSKGTGSGLKARTERRARRAASSSKRETPGGLFSGAAGAHRLAIGRQVPVRIAGLGAGQGDLGPERVARPLHPEAGELLGRRMVEDPPPRHDVVEGPGVDADGVVAGQLDAGQKRI